MERRRKTGPRATISRLDPTDYDASPFAISMYPNLDTFTEHGQIVIGYIEPAGAVAIAAEGRQTLATSPANRRDLQATPRPPRHSHRQCNGG